MPLFLFNSVESTELDCRGCRLKRHPFANRRFKRGLWPAQVCTAATQAAVAQAIAEQPTATQQQIAEKVGVSRPRVSQLVNEMLAKSEPKLLNHGGNMAEQGDYRHVERGSNKSDYILARLKRDGHQELATCGIPTHVCGQSAHLTPDEMRRR